MKKASSLLGAFVMLSCFVGNTAQADDGVEGMLSIESKFTVLETANRLERMVKAKGLKLFARIPHSEGASAVGVNLRPTELLIFGNPKMGAPIMQCQQTVALDLPQKMLIWKNQANKVQISYNAPAYLIKRHSIVGCEDVLEKMSKALAGLARKAGGV
ncbi:MAG: DUF302 domain-containing protein [Pseudomonadales bacterium]|uniref:DUF302 domain-containing protein n=1 Tax=Oleiphilus messinensis TaxID=141451 RepID=A0A1Y0IFH6_9GAMM|nr:DUF302 domain-containing protein [Oleiphilus messinensis]ARU58133.1 hypothetical protein OLMES_4116 [Oleiphilus messinensis]MCG8612281.1 DUF302 domain-containing protein [Pseudomonadales bacterium]